MDDRVVLTAEEATAMLALRDTDDGPVVHTFLNPGVGLMVGADWSRSDAEAHIREHGAELAGPGATSMGHGLVSGRVFFATVR